MYRKKKKKSTYILSLSKTDNTVLKNTLYFKKKKK